VLLFRENKALQFVEDSVLIGDPPNHGEVAVINGNPVANRRSNKCRVEKNRNLLVAKAEYEITRRLMRKHAMCFTITPPSMRLISLFVNIYLEHKGNNKITEHQAPQNITIQSDNTRQLTHEVKK
jgi:hypothetical protein